MNTTSTNIFHYKTISHFEEIIFIWCLIPSSRFLKGKKNSPLHLKWNRNNNHIRQGKIPLLNIEILSFAFINRAACFNLYGSPTDHSKQQTTQTQSFSFKLDSKGLNNPYYKCLTRKMWGQGKKRTYLEEGTRRNLPTNRKWNNGIPTIAVKALSGKGRRSLSRGKEMRFGVTKDSEVNKTLRSSQLQQWVCLSHSRSEMVLKNMPSFWEEKKIFQGWKSFTL